jgi:hypothetical protein
VTHLPVALSHLPACSCGTSSISYGPFVGLVAVLLAVVASFQQLYPFY